MQTDVSQGVVVSARGHRGRRPEAVAVPHRPQRRARQRAQGGLRLRWSSPRPCASRPAPEEDARAPTGHARDADRRRRPAGQPARGAASHGGGPQPRRDRAGARRQRGRGPPARPPRADDAARRRHRAHPAAVRLLGGGDGERRPAAPTAQRIAELAAGASSAGLASAAIKTGTVVVAAGVLGAGPGSDLRNEVSKDSRPPPPRRRLPGSAEARRRSRGRARVAPGSRAAARGRRPAPTAAGRGRRGEESSGSDGLGPLGRRRRSPR